MSELYNRIMELCARKGVSGYRLCRDVGVSPSVLTDLKMGRRAGLSAGTANRIASYFGVSVGCLLGQEEVPALINGDEELTEYLQELSTRSEMRMLFHVTKHATREQIEAIVKMVEAMGAGSKDGSDPAREEE